MISGTSDEKTNPLIAKALPHRPQDLFDLRDVPEGPVWSLLAFGTLRNRTARRPTTAGKSK
jgi:hypothetical protein